MFSTSAGRLSAQTILWNIIIMITYQKLGEKGDSLGLSLKLAGDHFLFWDKAIYTLKEWIVFVCLFLFLTIWNLDSFKNYSRLYLMAYKYYICMYVYIHTQMDTHIKLICRIILTKIVWIVMVYLSSQNQFLFSLYILVEKHHLVIDTYLYNTYSLPTLELIKYVG